MVIRHVIWKKDGQGGRLGVRLEDDNTLRVATLTGAALPARCLKAVLDAAIPGWAEIAEDLHLKRTHPWTVTRRYGSSGCVDYRLYYLRDEDFIDQVLSTSVHVSMYAKLNENMYIWLGDLAPIMALMLDDFGSERLDYCSVIEPRLRDYQQPGEPSGLVERLRAIETLEELQD